MLMKKVIIPKEYKGLRKAAAKTNARRIFIALIWYGFWAGTFIYYEIRGALPHNWVRFGILCAKIIIAFVFFAKLPALLSPGFEGVVERVKLIGLYATSGAQRKQSPRAFSHMKLVVRLADGSRRRVSFPLKYGHKKYYQPGDTVIKYHGLTYPYSPSGAKRSIFVCQNCGGADMSYIKDCLSCGCPVMKPEDKDTETRRSFENAVQFKF